MVARTALGDFLAARRASLGPADVGIAPGARRRVPGLRREEVAALAGISTDYYLRIEQGRIPRPSPQILDALARVLQMDAAAADHLRRLADPHVQQAIDDGSALAEGTQELLDALGVPAYIVSRYVQCLASNRFAQALSPNFVPGRNLLRALFLDPTERLLHADWAAAADSVVGGLRERAAGAASDRRLLALVAELSAASDDFRTRWAGAPVGYRPTGLSVLQHPLVGELRLRRRRFDIPDSGGQHLHIYQPEDPVTARRLDDLAERGATRLLPRE